jgi:hypothetical protein
VNSQRVKIKASEQFPGKEKMERRGENGNVVRNHAQGMFSSITFCSDMVI